MKLPESYHNRLSYIGTIISAVSLITIFFLFLVTVVFESGGSYTGLILYMALPAVLFTGLLLIPIGMFFRFRKIKNSKEEIRSEKVIFDFNNYKHRNAALIFVFGTIVFLMLTSVGSYEAFHYTESDEFCGTLCHSVMDPEFSTHLTSAHAKVRCVDCHVGSGAGWYVKSKMSGLYQVYSVLLNKYPHPIPTPISSLRPARETCEQCHWPEKFYSNKIRTEKHYLADSLNSQWELGLKMKIGSSHSAQGNSEGIHWHINKNVKIEYIPSSPARDYISWVKYINLETGDTTLYENTDDLLEPEFIAETPTRTMDCMDCHNRPSHQYQTPQDFIDEAISKGEISSSTPQIKFITMQVFNDPFDNLDTANLYITQNITEFYKENYPEYYKNNEALINQNIIGIKKAYAANVFPEMQANWDNYPEHIGHTVYNGCFRCHDDMHVSSTGKKISKDCNLCHTIVKQGTGSNMEYSNIDSGLVFKHPVDVDGEEKVSLCTDCHRYLYM